MTEEEYKSTFDRVTLAASRGNIAAAKAALAALNRKLAQDNLEVIWSAGENAFANYFGLRNTVTGEMVQEWRLIQAASFVDRLLSR
jgi:hypothetical protein